MVFDVTFIFHLTTQTPTRCLFSIPFSVFFHRERTTGTTTARGKLVSRTRKQIERENVEPSSFYQWTKKNFTDASFRGRRSSAGFQTRETASHGYGGTRDNLALLFIYFFISFSSRRSTKLCITELVTFPGKSVEKFSV